MAKCGPNKWNGKIFIWLLILCIFDGSLRWPYHATALCTKSIKDERIWLFNYIYCCLRESIRQSCLYLLCERFIRFAGDFLFDSLGRAFLFVCDSWWRGMCDLAIWHATETLTFQAFLVMKFVIYVFSQSANESNMIRAVKSGWQLNFCFSWQLLIPFRCLTQTNVSVSFLFRCHLVLPFGKAAQWNMKQIPNLNGPLGRKAQGFFFAVGKPQLIHHKKNNEISQHLCKKLEQCGIAFFVAQTASY